jgi:hypothetical protein
MHAGGNVLTNADDQAILCPACDYDLAGLPDGACPECGRAFTWRELLAKRERPRRWSWRDRRVALLGLAMAIWTGGMLVLLGLEELTNMWGRDPIVWGRGPRLWDFDGLMCFFGVMWGMTVLWCVHWLHDRPKRPLVLLWVWVPTLRTLLLLVALRTPEFRVLLAIEAVVGLTVLTWAFWREPVRSGWITGVAFTALAMALGAAYLFTGLNGIVSGEWWSIWEDFRPGQPYDQFSLTNREAVRYGGVLASVGLVAGIGLAVTYRRVWPVREA